MRRLWTFEEKMELSELFNKNGKFGPDECVFVSQKINRSKTAVQLMALAMGLLKKKKPLDPRKCKKCGLIFQPKRKETETCGVSCRSAVQSIKSKDKYPKTKKCLTCGLDFEIKRSSQGFKVNYCSRLCVGKYAGKFTPHKTVETLKSKCEKCGIEFEFKRYYKRKFCSRSCSSSFRKPTEKLKESSRKRMESLPNPYSNCKSEWFEIGGKRFFSKSSWERKYANVLELRKINKEISDWIYEPHRFWFDEAASTVRSYLPDFLVINNDGSKEYHEVKGWMTKRSAESIKLMKKWFPAIPLKVIDTKWFRENKLL